MKKNNSIISIEDIKVLWRIIYRNWYIPVIIVPIFSIIGYFYSYKLTSIYKASVELLLKSNDTYYKANLITDNDFYANSQSYIDNSNEIRVLKSFDLMKETVLRLKDKLQVSYYIVGRVRTTEQFGGIPFQINITTLNNGLYEKPVSFRIIDYDTYELSYKLNGQTVVKKGAFDKEFIDVDFNITVTRSGNVTRNAIASVKDIQYEVVMHSIEYLVYQFQSKLTVQNPDYTNVLTVSIEDIIPERAVLLLDTLSVAYTENSLKSRFEINDRTISYIDRQLEEVSMSLKVMEDTMQYYKQSNSILDLKWEEQDNFSKLSSYDVQKNKLGLQIEALNDLEKYIIEDKDPQFLPPTVYLVEGDGFLTKSVAELYTMQIKLNNLYNSNKENNPSVLELRQDIKKIKQDLLVYISNTRKATFQIIDNTSKEINKYISTIKEMPQKQRDLLGIQRKVQVNENLYVFLLERRANTTIAKASIVPDVKVIDSPRNMGIVKPDKKKIINLFISVGFILSVVIILIRFMFFTKIQTVDELKEKTYLPIVAELPTENNNGQGIIVDEKPNSEITEAFRVLRTNLQYVSLNSSIKTILVTSNSPGEGKTFTTLNLAAILAKSGKKVVIIELDLHKPRIHKALGLTADIGISTYLTGQNTLEQLPKQTTVANLDVILAGPIPPNPSEMVLSQQLLNIIDFAKQQYDYVFIDTPPAGLLSDAIYLIQYVDVSLFVVNTKFASRHTLNGFHKVIEDNGLKNIYLILNGVKRRKAKYYYNKYGYGYTYGYGYGYGYTYKSENKS